MHADLSAYHLSISAKTGVHIQIGDTKTREQHIPIIDALINDNEYRAQVNVLNNSALPGLPDDVAVEVPAVVTRSGRQ
ncbi:MAG: hypothetical protein ACP5J4_15510 [Anaerolineae bacterium]